MPMLPQAPDRKCLAITPGGKFAPDWPQWLGEGIAFVDGEAWDAIPALNGYATEESYLQDYNRRVAHLEKKDRRHDLWKLRDLRMGDLILANKGQSLLLGVGVVVAPGYVFRDGSPKGRHSVRVKWTAFPAPRTIPKQQHWLATIFDVPMANVEAWLDFVPSIRSHEGPVTADALAAIETELNAQGVFDPTSIEDTRARTLASVVQRRGQGAFREKLIARYGARCLISGCDVMDVVEAAHIMPYQGEATNHPENGLLLRADLHLLFDLGKLAVDPDDFTVRLDPALLGTSYGEFEGQTLRGQVRPSPTALRVQWEWAGFHLG